MKTVKNKLEARETKATLDLSLYLSVFPLNLDITGTLAQVNSTFPFLLEVYLSLISVFLM